MASSVPEARDVGELLAADRVHDDVVFTGVLADDHAFVELVARGDEEAAALLNLPESIGHGIAVVLGDDHAGAALADVAAAGWDRSRRRRGS